MLPISFKLRFDSIAEHVGYAFLFQVFDDGLVAMPVLQSINQNLHLGHPLLVFVDVVLILQQLEDGLETSSLLSKHCVLPASNFPRLFWLKKTSCRSCCCCCCSFHALFRTRRGAWSWAQCCSFPQVLTGCLLSTFENMFVGLGLCFGQCPACSFTRLLRHSFACSFPRLLKQNLNPTADSLGFWKHSDHKKKTALCSSLLKSNTLTSALRFRRFSFRLTFLNSLVSFWCPHIWFESWGPSWFYQTTNLTPLCDVLDTCLIFGLVPLMIIFITSSLSSKNGRLNFCP